MGGYLSQKQSVLDSVLPFEDAFYEVKSVKTSPQQSSPGKALYKKYQDEVIAQFNPLRFYNNFRLFYSIRKMEYSPEEMKEMQALMDQFNVLSWKYFKTYQESTKNPLFIQTNPSTSTNPTKNH